MSDRLDDLLAELQEFASARDWDQFHDPKNLVMLLASEVGELASEYRWIRNENADNYTSSPDARRRVESEIADVAMALLNLCRRLDIDITEAVRTKLVTMETLYPADEVRGTPDRPVRHAK